jgi:hypothetical protein
MLSLLEGASAFSSFIAPALCHHCPWGLIVALLLLAFAAGALGGGLITIVIVSANCRRFLWCGLCGVLGQWQQTVLPLPPARRRLREYGLQ